MSPPQLPKPNPPTAKATAPWLLVLAAAACGGSAPDAGDATATTAPAAADTAFVLPPRDFPTLVTLLLATDAVVRRDALTQVRARWAELRSDVAGMHRSADPAVRVAAAWLLGQYGGRDDADALVPLLADDHERVRRTATEAASRLHTPRVVAQLQQNLDRADFDETLAVVETLLAVDQQAAAAAAERLRADERWPQRRAAVAALRGLSDAGSAPALVALIDDPVWTVQVDAIAAAAARGLAEALPSCRGQRTHTMWQVRAGVATALGTFGERDDLALVAELATTDPERYARTLATKALRGFGAAAVPALQRILGRNGEHVKVRRAAIESAAAIGEPAHALLRAHAQDPDESIRAMVAQSLGAPTATPASPPASGGR